MKSITGMSRKQLDEIAVKVLTILRQPASAALNFQQVTEELRRRDEHELDICVIDALDYLAQSGRAVKIIRGQNIPVYKKRPEDSNKVDWKDYPEGPQRWTMEARRPGDLCKRWGAESYKTMPRTAHFQPFMLKMKDGTWRYAHTDSTSAFCDERLVIVADTSEEAIRVHHELTRGYGADLPGVLNLLANGVAGGFPEAVITHSTTGRPEVERTFTVILAARSYEVLVTERMANRSIIQE